MTFVDLLTTLVVGVYTAWQWAMNMIPDNVKTASLLLGAFFALVFSVKNIRELMRNSRRNLD